MARRITAEAALARIMELCEEESDTDSDISETNKSISDAGDNAANPDSNSTSEGEGEDGTEETEAVQDHIAACIDDVLRRHESFQY